MIKSVSLVLFNETTLVTWNLGKKFSISYSVECLLITREEVLKENANFILFWDANNILPTEEVILKVARSKGNLWHIGSNIGLTTRPFLLDAIQPTTMLHVKVDTSIDHSSWKNTFKGCLLNQDIFKIIEISNYSNSLDLIGLDFGYKAMQSGVLTRYSFELSKTIKLSNIDFSISDELAFIRNNFDAKAYLWCYLIYFFKLSPFVFLKYLRKKRNTSLPVYQHKLIENVIDVQDISTTIVIATLERYTVLENELKELRHLQPAPKEIIIVDQTTKEKRNSDCLKNFKDLPIKYIETDRIGQCSARNLGIKNAKTKFVWFLDDDMEEIPSDYLKKHLQTLYSLDADISCGIPDEIGTNYIDRTTPKISLSDGFPTNDVLIKRALLEKVGGFDEKMDQLQSEDQELGLRCVKKGALNIKNNQLRIVHLRASSGGLRNHNVRKVTFASSRNSLFQRRFLHYSELYLTFKHFTKQQVIKSVLLNIRGTFIVRGGLLKKIAKVIIGFIYLPDTIFKLIKRKKIAKKIYKL